ncbi:hypothetical protein J6590_046299 [Homalodisca vitripennis]|nr:hypothetical protein J6590_046299 [Homalodisca vitripennis]
MRSLLVLALLIVAAAVVQSITPKLDEEDIVIIICEHFDKNIQDARRVQNVVTIKDFEKLLDREDIDERQSKFKLNGEFEHINSNRYNKRNFHINQNYRPHNNNRFENHNRMSNRYPNGGYQNQKNWLDNHSQNKNPGYFKRPQDKEYPTKEQEQHCRLIQFKGEHDKERWRSRSLEDSNRVRQETSSHIDTNFPKTNSR